MINLELKVMQAFGGEGYCSLTTVTKPRSVFEYLLFGSLEHFHVKFHHLHQLLNC